MTTTAEPKPQAELPARTGLGAMLMIASAIVASTLGLSVRLVDDASGWQIIFYRSLSMALAVLLYLGFRHRQSLMNHLISVGRTGIVGGVCMAAATSFGVWAFLHTTIANVLFIGGTVPFFAGLLGWIVLREGQLRRAYRRDAGRPPAGYDTASGYRYDDSRFRGRARRPDVCDIDP